jgi:crotonobetainyl-CoA:carnitine CoA-transferase CaiB-like acyl-CoA transferase
VYDVAQALDSPFVAQSGMVQAVPHPDRPDLRVLASPIKIDGERPALTPAPKLGEANEALLERGAPGGQAKRR